jgi:hypothetical protein
VLTNRLARIIDRSRVLEDRLDVAYSDPYLNELDVLYRRSHLIKCRSSVDRLRPVCLSLPCCSSAISPTSASTNTLPACSWSVCCLVGSFVALLREIFIASAWMRSSATSAASVKLFCEYIMHDYQRPPTLYRYGVREDLELALTQGQFILRPASHCLTLSFSQGPSCSSCSRPDA